MRTRDSSGVTITTINTRRSDLPTWTVATAPDHVITHADGTDTAGFALIGPIRWLADSRLLVSDPAGARLLVFDSAGTFLRALGRTGSGPCEFRQITTVAVPRSDQVFVFDAALHRVSWFHPETGSCRGLDLPGETSLESWPAEAWPWRNSTIVVLQLSITPQESARGTGRVRPWQMRAQLTLRDSLGRIIRRGPLFDGMYTGLTRSGDMRLPFSNTPFVAVGRPQVLFGSGQPFTITILDSTFRVRAEVRWPSFPEPLTPAEVARVQEATRADLPANFPADRAAHMFDDPMAPEILPAMRPAIGRVLLDPAGAIWVERFEALRLGSRVQPGSDRWTVLDSTGKPAAAVQLRPAARLEAVTEDRIAVVVQDSLGLQRIEVLRLQKR